MTTMATPDARSRRRDRTRAEIVEAAWRLAERDGIAALSLRDLARDVGMRAPSLYTYFDSKAAIYDEMFADGYHELDAAIDGLSIDEDDPVGTLTRGIEMFLGFCLASVPRYQLMFTSAVPDWKPSASAYAVSVDSYTRMTGHLERIGIVEPHHVDLYTALASGLAAQQLANDPEGDRWLRLSDDAARMLLAHVRRQ